MTLKVRDIEFLSYWYTGANLSSNLSTKDQDCLVKQSQVLQILLQETMVKKERKHHFIKSKLTF